MTSASEEKNFLSVAKIDLRILSPSPELDGGILLSGLPVTTTIGELKNKVKENVASSPSVERQRFIFRGKVVGRDNAALVDVFGRENVI